MRFSATRSPGERWTFVCGYRSILAWNSWCLTVTVSSTAILIAEFDGIPTGCGYLAPGWLRIFYSSTAYVSWWRQTKPISVVAL